MSKLGLVLEGGGMRGSYTMGVLDFFMDQNLYADGVIGVSAGACNGCSYASKQRGRSWRINEYYLNDPRYMGLRSFLKTGDLFNVDFAYNQIPNDLDPYDYETFNQSNIDLYAVCSNVETGEAEYLKCVDMKKDVQYIRASASLPLLARIVELDGKKLLDGGVADSIPIQFFLDQGYDKNIVVLTQCREYRKGKNNLVGIIKQVYKQYPQFIKRIENRHNEYNQTLDLLYQLEKEGKIFIIQPKEMVKVSRLEKNLNNLKNLYDQGYEDAKNAYDDIMKYLKNER